MRSDFQVNNRNCKLSRFEKVRWGGMPQVVMGGYKAAQGLSSDMPLVRLPNQIDGLLRFPAQFQPDIPWWCIAPCCCRPLAGSSAI
jgi:hypothetical protein